ncbi:hypothetical protein CMEL01_15181 [Colletotrichum melonis]|uniref:Uncharacterized protein n=1 Tax=Colletotrichum melonis TaxID=1209925 RepID=A0AAI9ULW6_9PEZI|nr:hypothetical protein CMEL01_15181 [Colletotrichum melonis]
MFSPCIKARIAEAPRRDATSTTTPALPPILPPSPFGSRSMGVITRRCTFTPPRGVSRARSSVVRGMLITKIIRGREGRVLVWVGGLLMPLGLECERAVNWHGHRPPFRRLLCLRFESQYDNLSRG